MPLLEMPSVSPNAFIYVNTAFVVVCIAMAVVFMVLPLPSNAGLKKYRISLWFLVATYLLLAFLQIILMIFRISEVNLMSIDRLTIASLQAILFTITLIILLNPKFLVKRFLFIQIVPLIVLCVCYQFVAFFFGSPIIQNTNEFIQSVWHPALLLREVLMLFYIWQLGFFTHLFLQQLRIYEKEIDNYFVDNMRLHLPCVKFSYFASLTIGIVALFSCFVFSELWILVFTIVFAIFYMGFGVFYIQYPYVFIEIEPVIFSSVNQLDEQVRNGKKINWDDLKSKIVQDKYYLKAGVNIEDMSRHLGIGRTKLSMLINSEEGMNFNCWINRLRIELAKDLLINNNYSLTEIAEMVGYSEPSNFSRQFKNITNESPSYWRQANLVK